MRRIPGSRRLLSLMPILLVFPLIACDSSRIISGVYRSEEAVSIPGVAGFDDARWIEMMLAQFGPDLTGVVRVFDEEQFLVLSDGMCDCRYLENGTVSSGEVAFSFHTHGECPGNGDTPLVLGAFVFEEPEIVVDETAGDVLVGHFSLHGSDGPQSGQITFRRHRTWKQVGENDLSCSDPIVHSGTD